MILSHIVAASENGVIGVKGSLPWRIPEDLKFFKETTLGHVIIMGRKTFETLPNALPNRLNIVISRDSSYEAKGALVCKNIDQALGIAREHEKTYGNEVFIVGGGEIYRQTLDLVDRIYLTRVHQEFEGDAHYPDFNPDDFKLIKKEDHTKPIPFSFLTYERK